MRRVRQARRHRRALGRRSPSGCATSRSPPGPTRWRGGAGVPRPSSGVDEPRGPLPALPERAAQGRARRGPPARRGRPGRAVADHHGEAVRHRPGVARRSSTPELHEVFDESQIFRIDHFLGKEAAQNILAFRFANGLFEPIWNRNFIDHVQIDVPETLGLEERTKFYESTGAYRDMVVTHLMQVLAFMAMEPPTSLAPGPIGDEKIKVFRSMRPIEPHNVVRGQYAGYRQHHDRRRRLRHRDVHRAQGRDRQLALGGRAVLPAHRQEAGRGRADHLDRVQGAAADDVPVRLERRHPGAGPPHLRPRRPVARCRCRSTASDPDRA